MAVTAATLVAEAKSRLENLTPDEVAEMLRGDFEVELGRGERRVDGAAVGDGHPDLAA